MLKKASPSLSELPAEDNSINVPATKLFVDDSITATGGSVLGTPAIEDAFVSPAPPPPQPQAIAITAKGISGFSRVSLA